MKAMGNRIREERQKWNYTLEEVSERVGVSKATLSKLENGLLKRPPRPLIDKLANLFDCDPIYLMGYHHDDEVTMTYSTPGKEDVTLTAGGKPIIGEVSLRVKLLQEAAKIPAQNLQAAIDIIKALQ